MKIAMIGFRGIPNTYGGGEEFVRYLAPGLSLKGHEVTVYCWKHLFFDRSSNYMGVHRVFIPTLNHKFLGQLIHAFLSIFHAIIVHSDIIYIHTLPSGLHTVFAKMFNKRIIVNTDGFDWLRDKWGAIGKFYFKLSASVVVLTAKELVSDANGIRQYYLNKYRRDSKVIAYGANIEKSQNLSLIDEYLVKPFEYYLVACRFVPENNIDLIIRAYELVKSDKILLIAGSANYKSDYIEHCKKTLDKRIVFLGHIDDYLKVKELHCNCYAYLHGHSMGGTNPALLKALGYGNCILALNTVFNREVLINEYGLLFKKDINDLRKKIQYINDRPSVAEEYRRKASYRIKEAYTWGKIINQYDELFSQVFHIL